MSDGTTRSRRTVRWLLVGLGVVVVAALVVVVVTQSGTRTPAGQTPAASVTASPTATDVPSDEPSPAQSPQQCSQDDPCADAPLPVEPGAPVTVLVTSSGWDSGRDVAWVAADIGVLDPSGTCTATLRRGQTQVVAEAPAEPGPATTTCAVEVDGSRLGAGQWLVSLSYVSPQHSGAAPDVSIMIP